MTDKLDAVRRHVIPGDPRPGRGWCPHCRLDTVATAPVYLIGVSGVLHLGDLSVCVECGR